MRRWRLRRGGVATWVAAVGFALACPPARRASAVVDSIEAMVADADVVAVATLGGTWPLRDKAAHWPRSQAVVRFVEVIKGTPPGETTTLLVPSSFDVTFRQWNHFGGRKLIFLVRPERAAWHPQGTLYPLALRTYGWELREPYYDSQDKMLAPNAVTPTTGAAIAFTLDMRPLYGFDEAVAEARKSAARTLGGVTRYELLAVPEESPLRRATPIFSTEKLRIPVDDRAEKAAQNWAWNPAYAEQTAAVLGHFDSDLNAAILTRLMNDPRHTSGGRPGKMVTWHYPVRERAHQALERWGRAPARPAIRGPHDFYRRLGARHLAGAAASVMVPAGAVWLVRRRRRRGAEGDSVASATTLVPPVPRRFPVVATVLAAAFVGLVWLDRRSRSVVHELTVSAGDARYWVSAYRGGMQFVRIHAWPRRQPLSYGRFDLAHVPASQWNGEGVFPAADRQLVGFRRISGTIWGDLRGGTYPYASVTVPTPAVAAVVALLPAWQAVALVRDRLRRRAWLRGGRCGACGYDLRGVPEAERCTECGAARPAPPRLVRDNGADLVGQEDHRG